MVVDDFHFISVVFAPDIPYTPLVIEPYLVLSCSFPSKLFQAVGGRIPAILQCLGGIEDIQLATRHTLNIVGQFP